MQSGLALCASRIDVGAPVEESLHDPRRDRIGCSGRHENGAPIQPIAFGVGAVIEQEPGRIAVAETCEITQSESQLFRVHGRSELAEAFRTPAPQRQRHGKT